MPVVELEIVSQLISGKLNVCYYLLNVCCVLNLCSLGGTLPFGQLPAMEVDGKMMCQSLAMFKFVARETGANYIFTDALI